MASLVRRRRATVQARPAARQENASARGQEDVVEDGAVRVLGGIVAAGRSRRRRAPPPRARRAPGQARRAARPGRVPDSRRRHAKAAISDAGRDRDPEPDVADACGRCRGRRERGRRCRCSCSSSTEVEEGIAEQRPPDAHEGGGAVGDGEGEARPAPFHPAARDCQNEMYEERQEERRCHHGHAAGEGGALLPAHPVRSEPDGAEQHGDRSDRTGRPLPPDEKAGQDQPEADRDVGRRRDRGRRGVGRRERRGRSRAPPPPRRPRTRARVPAGPAVPPGRSSHGIGVSGLWSPPILRPAGTVLATMSADAARERIARGR